MNMSEFTVMFKDGLAMIRDRLVDFCKLVEPNRDYTSLQNCPINFPFDWDDMCVLMKMGARKTTYSRYLSWWRDSFRGTKRIHDNNYSPPDSDDSSADARHSPDRIDPVSHSRTSQGVRHPLGGGSHRTGEGSDSVRRLRSGRPF